MPVQVDPVELNKNKSKVLTNKFRDVIQYGQNFLKCFEKSYKNVLSYSYV